MEDASSTFTNPGPQNTSAMTATLMSHASLAMRAAGNPSQVSSTAHADQQETAPAVAEANSNLNPNSLMFNPSLTLHEFHRMTSEATLLAARRELMDPGLQSPEDFEFFMQNLRYPTRSIENVNILVGHGIRTRERGLIESSVPRSYPASACTTFPNLMNATRADLEDTFVEMRLTPPANGVQPGDLMVWYKRTYGDNQYDWIEAQRTGDYAMWFDDYVVHGRSSTLHLMLRYRGPV